MVKRIHSILSIIRSLLSLALVFAVCLGSHRRSSPH